MRLAGVLAVAAACGDNTLPDGDPLEAAANVAVVARAPDRAVMQPDLDDLIARRTGVTIVYLADADATTAELAAIAGAGGLDPTTWRCGRISIAGHRAQHCHLPGARVSLVYLGLDGVDALWSGDVDTLATYDRDAVADAVLAVISVAHAKSLRTLDPLGRGFTDPSEPIAGAVGLIAAARLDFTGQTLAFRGGSTRAAVGIRGAAHGRLTLDHAQCVTADASGTVSVVDCASAPTWAFTPDGRLHLDDRCMQTLPTDELVVGACGTGARFAYRLDDEGHIWTGSPPIIGPSGIRGDADCLFETGGRVRAHGCAATDTLAWSVDPTIVTATTTLAKTGRALRLGDLTGDGLADLCVVDAGGLRCAAGDGLGGFASPARIDKPANPLAIEPDSLVIGDLDGDGKPDACGHVASGILCALAADDFAAFPWSSAFDTAATVASTAKSFAIASPEICALAKPGILCVAHAGTTSPPPVTSVPLAGAPTWILDAHHWCTLAGPALVCGDGATGAPADFGAAPPPAHGTVDSTQFADLDGDGFLDRCTFTDAMRCARGQGYGFGPEILVTGLTGNPELGDLDGDGIADLCTDAIACVR